MPFFKSTYNILKKPDEDEVFNVNWLDSDTLKLPPKIKWDYGRELRIEDIDIWEVLYEASGGIGVYAAWLPHAEFYMITTGWKPKSNLDYANPKNIETFYGPGAAQDAFLRAKKLGINLQVNKVWVDNDDLWLYQK
jgi:hypothetical protein